MAENRLFIYDPDTNDAVCIGKGYVDGWRTHIDYQDDWFDAHPEYNPTVTRFRLVTEHDIPPDADITWEPVP